MFPLLATFAACLLTESADKRALRKGRDTGPPSGAQRDYWNAVCASGKRAGRTWQEIVAEYDHATMRPGAPKVSPAPVEVSPAPPAPATVKRKRKVSPAPAAPVANVAPTMPDAPTVAPATPPAATVSDVPGLRLTPPVRKPAPAPAEEREDAPPFTGCKDHPVKRSGYCTRCAECEDAE